MSSRCFHNRPGFCPNLLQRPMVVVDWPMSIIYGICTLGIAAMTFRAVQVAIQNWRSGSSVLTRVGREGRHQ